MTKIGNIYVEVRGDYTKYEQDLRQVRQLAKGMSKDVSDNLNNALSPSRASKGITDLTRNLMQFQASAKASGSGFRASADQISAGLSDMARKAGITQKEFAGLQERMLRTQAAAAQERALQSIAKATGATSLQMVRLRAQLGDTQGAARQFAGLVTAGFGRVTGAVLSLKGALAGLGLSMLARDIFQAGAQAEGLEKAFEAITGSSVEAGREMAYLRKVADELGMNFYSLAESYKGLLVSGAGTTIFEGVVNAGAALQLSGDAIKGVLLAVEQMASKGVVSMEELRKQMGERLPGSFEMAANAMGMTAQEFSKAVAQGKILASDLLPALGRALTDRFGRVARENATSAARSLDKFQESWTDLKVHMAESGFLEAASEAMRDITEVFRDERTKEGMRALGQLLGDMARVLAEATKNAVGLKAALDTIPAEVWGLLIGAGVGGRLGGPYGALAGGALGLGAGVRAGQEARGRETPEQARLRLIREKDAAITSGSGVGHYTGEGVFGQDFSKQVTGLTPANLYADLYDEAVKKVSPRDLSATSAAEARSVVTAEQRGAGSLAVYQAKQERTEKNLELERDFYAELGTLSGNNEVVQRAALEREYEVYSKVIKDKEALAAWLKEREMRLNKDWRSGATLALREYGESATNWARQTQQVFTNAFRGMEDALVEFTMTGKLNFTDFANSVIRDINRILIQQSITGPIAQGIGSLLAPTPNADGNVYGPSGLVPFAKGGVVTRPTIFPFANGIGLMGEAGPEAIMPLKRGADGKLGVEASGGGGPRSVRVEVHNESGERLQISRSEASFDAQEMVVSLWLDAFQRNRGGLRSALTG